MSQPNDPNDRRKTTDPAMWPGELERRVDQQLSQQRERRMASGYTLIEAGVSNDTVEAVKELLTMAEAGVLQGIAFGGMLKGRKYLVDCAGTACTDPTLARGIVAALDDELHRMVQQRIDRNTTT